MNHIYVGTQYFFRFDFGAKSLYFNVTLKKDCDDQLADLRDYVSELIAARLSRQLDTLNQVAWTTRLRFVRDGIEYFHKNEWHHLLFCSVGNCEIDQGIFYLRDRDSEFP